MLGLQLLKAGGCMVRDYQLEDLFQSINDIFEQYDMGKIQLFKAEILAKQCCEHFVKGLENVSN